MRKYGKWVLTLGLLAAAPGLTLAAGSTSPTDEKPAAETKKAPKAEDQKGANEVGAAMRKLHVKGDIAIEFKSGVVVLSGTVVDAKMRERASEAARKVHSVKKVDNRLVIGEKTPPASERAVAQKNERPATEKSPPTAKPAAQAANQMAARTPAKESSAPARPNQRVEQVAHQTPADAASSVISANHTAPAAAPSRVQQVNAELPVGGVSGNQEIAEQIGAALSSANLDGYEIEIRFQNGVALLSGSVGTQAEKATATRVVQAIPGVGSVANRLTCTQDQMSMAAGPAYRGAPGQMPPQMGGQMPPQYAPQQYAPQQYVAQQMPPQHAPGMPPQMQGQYPPAQMYQAGYRQGEAPMPGGPGPMGQPGMNAMPMAPSAPMPPNYGQPAGGGTQAMYNQPSVPDYAWPAYAQYPNSAAVSYPQQYSASAWPYIGPFYPYPQVPLGWRDATLRWDDGQWNLMFRTRTDKWWWFFNPNNW